MGSRQDPGRPPPNAVKGHGLEMSPKSCLAVGSEEALAEGRSAERVGREGGRGGFSGGEKPWEATAVGPQRSVICEGSFTSLGLE